MSDFPWREETRREPGDGIAAADLAQVDKLLNKWGIARYGELVLQIVPRANRLGYDAEITHRGVTRRFGQDGQIWRDAKEMALNELCRCCRRNDVREAGTSPEKVRDTPKQVEEAAPPEPMRPNASIATTSQEPELALVLDSRVYLNASGGLAKIPDPHVCPPRFNRFLVSLLGKQQRGLLDRHACQLFGRDYSTLSGALQMRVLSEAKVRFFPQLTKLLDFLETQSTISPLAEPPTFGTPTMIADEGRGDISARAPARLTNGQPIDRHESSCRPLIAESTLTGPTTTQLKTLRADALIHETVAAVEFAEVKRIFDGCCQHSLADAPLTTWVLPSDRQVPIRLAQQTLRRLLDTPFSILAKTRGIGSTRLEGLIRVLDRAVRSIRNTTGENSSSRSEQSPSPALTRCHSEVESGLRPESFSGSVALEPSGTSADRTADRLDAAQWRALCDRIREHGLQSYPIGRFAHSLRDLPSGLWNERLSTFVDRSLVEFHQLPGYGSIRLQHVVDVVWDLASFLSQLPPSGHFKLLVLPSAIRDLANWIERVLRDNRCPDFTELRRCFVLPLLGQLATDLGPEVAEMVERRLGADGEPQTLEQIATAFGLTRERIRQLTTRAMAALQVRWPEGKHLLDDFFERLCAAPSADDQVGVVRRALDLLFAVETTSGASRTEVITAWETAGRQKLTPMSKADMHRWLGHEFPLLSPALGRKWIEQDSQTLVISSDRVLYFTTDDLDTLLYDLYRRGQPTALAEMRELEGEEERNLRCRLSRDLRFVEDEFKRYLPSEYCSFVREANTWHVELVPLLPTSSGEAVRIAVEGLAHLTVAGLVQAGIVDATVWGVHRYANEMVQRIFGAKLPNQVTPFILADMLVRETGGLIRPMRRRRLRWDNEHQGIPVRGKRGWIGYVVSETMVPVTVDELGDLLRKYYQDYAPYVLDQINLDVDEEGSHHCSAVLLPGVPHRVPAILVPADWQYDPQRENVSDEIRLLVAKITVLVWDDELHQEDLAYAPWLIDLVARGGYGENIWQKTRGLAGRGTPGSAPNPAGRLPAEKKPLESSAGGQRRLTGGADVDDLLAKFL